MGQVPFSSMDVSISAIDNSLLTADVPDVSSEDLDKIHVYDSMQDTLVLNITVSWVSYL